MVAGLPRRLPPPRPAGFVRQYFNTAIVKFDITNIFINNNNNILISNFNAAFVNIDIINIIFNINLLLFGNKYEYQYY